MLHFTPLPKGSVVLVTLHFSIVFSAHFRGRSRSKDLLPRGQHLVCFVLQNCVTHRDSREREEVTVKWKAPKQKMGDIDIK